MRIQFKIRTLLILTTLLAVMLVYYSFVFSQIKQEQATLERLESSGFRVEAKFETIDNWYRERGTFKTIVDWPVHRFVGIEETRTRCTSLDLSSAGNYAGGSQAAIDLSCLSDFEYLKQLTLWSKISTEEIGALRGLKHLVVIYLHETEADDSYTDSLLQIGSLECVWFGKNKVSIANFDRLADAGIEVAHGGLRDFVLEKNFVCVAGVYYPADLDNAKLCACFQRDTEAVSYHVDVPLGDHKYCSTFDAMRLRASFESCNFTLAGDWRKLDGFNCSFEFPPDTYYVNFFDAFDHETIQFKGDFKSTGGNRFRTRWDFGDEGEVFCSVDVELPLPEVYFLRSDKFSAKEAEALMKKHFDLDDFDEPIIDETAWYSIRYPLKLDVENRK